MNRLRLIIAAPLVLAISGCSAKTAPEGPSAGETASQAPPAGSTTPATPEGRARAFPVGKWEMVSSGEGDGLFFAVTEGEPGKVHIFCPTGDEGILINVNAFSPVGSEERLSFGSGAEVIALVADPEGDAMRGGVSGKGDVPANLLSLLTGGDGVVVGYGSQRVGPLPPVPDATARAFAGNCRD